MIKPIVKDILFLGQKSEEATKNDIVVVDDLIDTLRVTWSSKVATPSSINFYRYLLSKGVSPPKKLCGLL